MMQRVRDVREQFVNAYIALGTHDPTISIPGASFIADEHTIFGKINHAYIAREMQWYRSGSLSIKNFPPPVPAIWEQVAGQKGEINSNYGALLWGEENGRQYQHVLDHLRADQYTRRAVAIYTRPSMHEDYTREGATDFVCTNAVHYRIIDDHLEVVVQMRSNDAVFGYRNDYAWQVYAQQLIVADLLQDYPALHAGRIIWQVANLHIYARHYHLIKTFMDTGEWRGPVTEKKEA